MKCDICNSQETYVKDYEHNYNIKGKNICFVSKRRFCKLCNNLVYDSVLDNKVSEIAISEYNKKCLTKIVAVYVKKLYNMTQRS